MAAKAAVTTKLLPRCTILCRTEIIDGFKYPRLGDIIFAGTRSPASLSMLISQDRYMVNMFTL